MHALQNIWVRFRIDLARSESHTVGALLVLTLLASSAIRNAAGENSLAFVTFVVRDRVRSEFVSRIAERIFVLLRSMRWLVREGGAIER